MDLVSRNPGVGIGIGIATGSDIEMSADSDRNCDSDSRTDSRSGTGIFMRHRVRHRPVRGCFENKVCQTRNREGANGDQPCGKNPLAVRLCNN
jgi:hypothetical protein